MRDFPTQVGPGGEPVSDVSSWTSSNANDSLQEIQNSVQDTGQVLIPLISPPDNSQLSIAMSRYAGTGTFYSGSGTANAQILTSISTYQGTEAYQAGQTIRWFASNANTGPTTVNVNGIGVVDIVDEAGGALTSGFIDVVALNIAQFDIGSGDFIIIRAAGVTSGPIPSFMEEFISAEQALVQGSTVSLNHGLTGVPKLVEGVYRCKTAEFGWAVGDEVVLNFLIQTDQGVQFGFNATQVFAIYGSGAAFNANMNKTTHSTSNFTLANWRLVMRAWR